jgi:ABC-type transport system involved in multi-copper enzyme maturation permease subunit
MTQLLSRLGLPLLTKELIEQSARRRTYVIRVIYALLLFSAAGMFSFEKLRASTISPLAILGTGRELFVVVVALGFGGIYLFMPAITCSVISQEKERASLQLLFLTRLGPWALVFEKLFGRVIPMLGFLLLSLPLLGFAYTLGGVSRQTLWTAVWLLVLAVIQMGTLALACSAFFRTTVGSFAASYVIALLMLFGPFFAGTIAMLIGNLFGFHLDDFISGPGSQYFSVFLFVMMPFFGLMWFGLLTESPGAISAWGLLAHSLAVLSVSAAFLVLTRRWLVSRAFLPPRNWGFDLLRKVEERLFRRSAPSPAGQAQRRSAHLPLDEPIAWRETTKRALGRPLYLFVMLLALEIPLVLLLGLVSLVVRLSQQHSDGSELLDVIWVLLWALAVLVVSVRAASLIAGERSHQTLDVLCTTPLTGREIVLQKMRGVRALLVFFAVPFLTLFAFHTDLWPREHSLGYGWSAEKFDPMLYFVCAALAVTVYLPLVAWISLLISLRIRSQARAIVVSLVVILAICAAPAIFLVMPVRIAYSGATDAGQLVNWLSLTSPASIILKNEWMLAADFDRPWLAVCVNFTAYGVLLLAIRWVSLTYADRWLGRCAAEGAGDRSAREDGARRTIFKKDGVDAAREGMTV